MVVQERIFAESFPVKQEHHEKKKATELDLHDYDDLVDVSDTFKTAFYNSGVMYDGKIYSEELSPNYTGPQGLLGDIVLEEPVDEKYFISQNQIQKWEYMKGSKRLNAPLKKALAISFRRVLLRFQTRWIDQLERC